MVNAAKVYTGAGISTCFRRLLDASCFLRNDGAC